MHTRRGFSLVELLVVMGIFAILIGLLMPALVRARQSAMQIECASNLRQWGAALHLYANTQNGWLPRRGQGVSVTNIVNRPSDWFNVLPPMMRTKAYVDLAASSTIPRPPDQSIWICPAMLDKPATYFFAYAMNMWLSPTSSAEPDRLNRVGPWESMVFMTDGPGDHCSVLPRAADYSPVARHHGRINICFVDGHVSTFTGDEVGCGIGDPLRCDIRWVVPNSSWSGP